VSSIQIIADDRESQAPVIDALRRLNGAEVTVRRLALGDYLLDQRLSFERKTLLDLPHSKSDCYKHNKTHSTAVILVKS
jgi:DNA excision repair protein ERCC-4